MDFLLDVNASGAIARWLIDRGHNVAEVGQTDPRMSDDKILSWALRERRIIVTTYNDFEEMIWRQGKSHCGVLRLENLPRSERITLLNDVLHCHAKDLEDGLLRQYFPKGTDFRKVTEEDLAFAVKKLNYRPRKCLGYQSPQEVFWNTANGALAT